MANDHYLIVADDFTGSNDTGVQLRRRGIPVSVVFSVKMMTGDGSFVLDTESRAMPSRQAAATLVGLLEGVDLSRFAHVMKKVDSTLRGNVAVETKALDDIMRRPLVIFSPAIPDLGRTTVSGLHCLNGTRITETELARDPKTPVREDNIKKILEQVYDEPVAHIGSEIVSSGKIDLSRGRIFTFDAATNADLRTIVAAALATGKRILWVGAAALADILLETARKVPPALAVIGSLSSVSRRQAEFAAAKGVAAVPVSAGAILDGKATARQYADEVVANMRNGRDAMLLSAAAWSAEGAEQEERAAGRHAMSREDMGIHVQKILADVSAMILENTPVSGLFLTGGDTAIAVFDAAGSQGSAIDTEIAIGIPMMRLRGGAYDGMKVVTKAGAFGGDDAIFYALRKLKEIDI